MIQLYFLLIVVWLLDFLTDGTLTKVFGCGEYTAWYTHFTYMFAHVNVFHLAINLFVLHKVSNLSKKVLPVAHFAWLFVVCMLAAAVASCGTCGRVPTVGFSGVIFALMGLNAMLFNRKFLLLTCLSVTACSALGFFQEVNVPLHLFAFGQGLLYGVVYGKSRH